MFDGARPTRRRGASGGGTCIYCLEWKGEDGFRKAEHVLPESFGRFRDNLTLHGVVCDACNQLFGDTIELYLARDTADGLSRYLIGGKDPSAFRPPRKSSSVVIRMDSGPFKGAFVTHRAGEGVLELKPEPQVGFGKSKDGPFTWFLVEKLPTPEELHALLEDGHRHVYFLEVDDPQPVDDELRARGLNLSGVIEAATRPKSRQRFNMWAPLEMEFGRAITKIALNYLAHQHGARTALMAEFNTARRFVRHGGQPEERRIWTPLQPPVGTRPRRQIILAIKWHQRDKSVTAEISFHNATWYRATLGTDFIVVPTEDRGHIFDLERGTVRRIK